MHAMAQGIRESVILIVALTLLCLNVDSRGCAAECSVCDTGDLSGPRCLLAICERLGLQANLNETISLYSAQRENVEGTGLTSLSRLYSAAKSKGLEVVAAKVGLEELARMPNPAIAHLWGNHFVLVEGAHGMLSMTDYPAPARDVTKEDFQQSYSGFALLVTKDKKPLGKRVSNGSDLRFEVYSYDWGFIEQGIHVTHIFKFTNKGNKQLTIGHLRTTCDCTSASVSRAVIPPGGNGEVTVTFDGQGLHGLQGQVVYVESNDPISPVVQLAIGGVIKPERVLCSPSSLSFGSLRRGEGVIREIYVRDPGDGSLEVRGVESDCPMVTVRLAQDVDGKRSGYLVTATLREDAPLGEITGKITIRTNHPKEPTVEIPFSGIIKGDLEVFPDTFYLGFLKKGQEVGNTIKLSTVGKQPLLVEWAESPFEYLHVDIKTEIEGKSYAVTAKLDSVAPVGYIRGDVILHTNNPDQPEVKVPVYALVQNE